MKTVSIDLVERAIGFEFPASQFSYDERDLALYALGIGAPSDWLDQDELKFVYEGSSLGFQALPTFAVIFAKDALAAFQAGSVAGLRPEPMATVHGDQALELLKPLPARATVTTSSRIAAIHDKGSGMLITLEVKSVDERGEALARSRIGLFIRGLGGYGGERGSSQRVEIPRRAPDIRHEEKTLDRQALLYRLSSDVYPLHVDPDMARIGGFDKPILHGLCSFGFASRAIIKRCCDNRPGRLRSISSRFAAPVFPGETLRTEIWSLGAGELAFQCLVAERGDVALSRGRARLRD